MRLAGLACVLAGALALPACGAARPRPAVEPAPMTAGVQGTPAVPGLVPNAAGPRDAGTSTLNSRLLTQVSPPTANTDLPIGPGDLIEVSVFEVEELSKLKFSVPLRGTITLPLLGPVPAAGRTAIELEDELRVRLQQKYMHDPQVSVFVHEHKSQRISVIGAVTKGGVYTISSRLRLADALALAEGLTVDADHLVYLIRRLPAGTVARAQAGTGPPSPSVPPLPAASATDSATEEIMVAIDLDALANGKQELNVPLEAGDVVHVPRAGSFYVGGSVEKPGSYFLKSTTTVQQAILAAGGVKDVADWGDVRLYRTRSNGERQLLAFNLNDFENGHTAPEIEKNDVVVVGKSTTKAFWYGVGDFFKYIFHFGAGL